MNVQSFQTFAIYDVNLSSKFHYSNWKVNINMPSTLNKIIILRITKEAND